MDHATLHRIENIGLFVLNRLLDRYDAVHMAARQGGIIGLASLGGGKAAFHQADIAADDGRDMLAGLEPVAVEDRHAGVGRGQNDIDPAYGLFGRCRRLDVEIGQRAHFVSEFFSILGIAAVDFYVLELAHLHEREQMVLRLAGGAE